MLELHLQLTVPFVSEQSMEQARRPSVLPSVCDWNLDLFFKASTELSICLWKCYQMVPHTLSVELCFSITVKTQKEQSVFICIAYNVVLCFTYPTKKESK